MFYGTGCFDIRNNMEITIINEEIVYIRCLENDNDIFLPIEYDNLIGVKEDVKKKEITIFENTAITGVPIQRTTYKEKDADRKVNFGTSKDFFLCESPYENIKYLVNLRKITGWYEKDSCYFVVSFGEFKLSLRNNYLTDNKFKNILKSIQNTN